MIVVGLLGDFCDELMSFCDEKRWICADMTKLDMDSGTYAYLSETQESRLWLVHCVAITGGFESVVNVFIDYSVCCPDR